MGVCWCFVVSSFFCGRAKKVVREGPISGGLKRVCQVEEALRVVIK